MVIHSPFKDYYDFVANQYGGGDPRIVYPRSYICTSGEPGSMHSYTKVMHKSSWPRLNDPNRSQHWEEKPRFIGSLFSRVYDNAYLIVCGKAYLIYRKAKTDLLDYNLNTFKVLPPGEEKPTRDRKYSWYHNWIREHPHYGIEFGKELPFLVELSRIVKAPVFSIISIDYDGIHIPGQVPILGCIGMPSLVPAFQMYQDIAYFVGNTLKERPDTDPPVELSNRERILKAGFDLKRSFRHRKP